ncbi:hypothetical protein C3428_09960 [Citrobacter braakii]|nr:hypothetical protein C3428_09960 [Citrobacter braakii]
MKPFGPDLYLLSPGLSLLNKMPSSLTCDHLSERTSDNYANSLRTSAIHPDIGNADPAGGSSITSSALTYCEIVIWIKPLLAAIEKANNQLAGIR